MPKKEASTRKIFFKTKLNLNPSDKMDNNFFSSTLIQQVTLSNENQNQG
jgi:hypothetical protein